jgi:diacylglycerol kinase (ATP)
LREGNRPSSAHATPVRALSIVLNPTSGAGEGKRVRAEVERELHRRGLDFAIAETEGPGHAVELARAAVSAGASIVVAAGGDGTIHEVANGILSVGAATTTALGMIPIGRGNDFVKVVQGTRPRAQAYDTLAAGVRGRVDAGLVTWHGGAEWFVNAVGTGIDVEVVRQIARTRKLPAALVYIVGLVKALVRFRAIPLRITVDGREFDREVMLVAVANGTTVGGRFKLCPAATPDDGRLDVCIIDAVSLWRAARVASRILRGVHVGLPVVHMLTAREVTIQAIDDAPIFMQMDGELREPAEVTSVRVSIAPGVLPVITSKGAEGVGAVASTRIVGEPEEH